MRFGSPVFFCLSYGFSSCGDGGLHTIVLKEAPVSTMYFLDLRLCDRFRRRCICLFVDGRVAYQELRFVPLSVQDRASSM